MIYKLTSLRIIITVLTVFIAFLISEVNANPRVTLSLQNMQTVGSVYTADLWASMTTDAWTVGFSTIVVNFNEAKMTANLDQTNFDAQLFSAGYSAVETYFSPGMTALTIKTTNPNVPKTGAFKITTLQWSIINGSLSDGLSINTDNTALYNIWDLLTYNCTTNACYATDVTTMPIFAPAPIIPINGSNQVTTNPVLQWSTIGTATSYFGQYATLADFSNSNTFSSTSSTVTLTGLQNNTQYYWRVQAINSTGQTSLWSTAYNFTTGVGGSLATPSKNVAITMKMQGLWDDVNQLHQPVPVSVELRSGTDLMSSTTISRKTALIDYTGLVTVNFGDVSDGSYWVVVRSAGYMPLGTTSTINLSTSGATYDFTTNTNNAARGTHALIQLNGVGPFLDRFGDFDWSRSIAALDINAILLNNLKNVSGFVPAP